MTTTEPDVDKSASAPAPKDVAAIQTLEVLLDKPVPDHAIPAATSVQVLPDGGVRVGKYISIWRKIVTSSTLWLQAIAGTLAAIWLAIPQQEFIAVIPAKYTAWGVIAYAALTSLARMRTM